MKLSDKGLEKLCDLIEKGYLYYPDDAKSLKYYLKIQITSNDFELDQEDFYDTVTLNAAEAENIRITLSKLFNHTSFGYVDEYPINEKELEETLLNISDKTNRIVDKNFEDE